ncbi:MAG: VOC family protein [Verrucomicrobiales bacterium]|jgi:lactoylglutathione lyase|nr:VOC family protein [Verrucomicrobiales bacterium]
MKIKIEHVAIWVRNLELMKDFYVTTFHGKAGELYHNPTKQFRSYFIAFGDGCRLELMHRPAISDKNHDDSCSIGITHLAFSVGSKESVDLLTGKLRQKGHAIASEPRTAGDGYYESVILDPEGNSIELTE